MEMDLRVVFSIKEDDAMGREIDLILQFAHLNSISFTRLTVHLVINI